jgi:Coenzyme PQQ synthesis protein D (PqqD)
MAGQMMVSATRFTVNNQFVAFETFDDEVLAVNLDTGTYYSMMGISARIWQAIVARQPIADAAAWLSNRYDAPPAAIEAHLAQFFEELSVQGLIVPAGDDAISTELAPAAAERRLPFEVPAMTIHTDMQDLLLLDPIHDVDEAGWPVFKPDADQKPV